ncbi:hypothetical protein AB0K71_06095 [Streptomyces syringium]|uniref:hypothetical protein n=1 Tax=Streptomyces syringium TaxID=76729 RepID=UPI0034499F48
MSARRTIFDALTAGSAVPQLEAAQLLNEHRDEVRREITQEKQHARVKRNNNRASHIDVAAKAKATPLKWVLVATYKAESASGLAHQVRSAMLTSYRPAGAFEAECRRSGRDAELYVRYVGARGGA